MTRLLMSSIQANKCTVTVETQSFMKIKHDPRDRVTAHISVFALKAAMEIFTGVTLYFPVPPRQASLTSLPAFSTS